MQHSVLKALTILLLAGGSLGFRLGWANKMSADPLHPEIYLHLCAAHQGQLFQTNTIAATDPLAAMANVTAEEVLATIMDDYNAITSSFLRLKNMDEDPAAIAANKIITICQGTTQGLGASAQAQTLSAGGCTITLGSGIFQDVNIFVGVLTHEVGHCLGLDHAHEMNALAIMSYFAPPEIVRLQVDDKLGITHLYPVEELEYQNNWGLRCQRQE